LKVSLQVEGLITAGRAPSSEHDDECRGTKAVGGSQADLVGLGVLLA
jgi:hypothetical protein